MNFVGREQELAELETRYEEILKGKGNILFLSGDIGMGKTSLVHHWYRGVSLSLRPPLFVKAVCTIPMGGSEVGTLESLEPWADILTQLVTLGPLQHTPEKIDISRLVHDVAPSWIWAIPNTRKSEYGNVSSTNGDQNQEGDISGVQAAESQPHIFQQYTNILHAISQNHPLVLFIDDMHWADASSCSLLAYLSHRVTNSKIFIILTYCDSGENSTNSGKKDALLPVKNEILSENTGFELVLPSLNQQAVQRLLSSTISNYKPDEGFESWIRLISRGNALFITEYVKTLLEDGLLDKNGKFIGDYDVIVVPNSSYAVIFERIQRLDSETRKLLSYATAEGELFTEYALIQAIGKKQKEILPLLKNAALRGIIWFIGTRQLNENRFTTIFSFAHALFHQALYNAMNEDDRAAVHRSYLKIFKGEWANENNEQRKALIAPKLLIHAERCGDLVFVAKTALAAAQMFWTEFSESESLQMTSQVAKYADIVRELQPESYDNRFKRHVVYEYQILNAAIDLVRGRFEEAKRWYFNAEKTATELYDEHAVIDALNGYANIFKRREEFKELARIIQPICQRAEAINYTKGKIDSLISLGIATAEVGDKKTALDCFQQVQAIAERANLPVEHMRALTFRGHVYMFMLEFSSAIVCFQKVLELSEKHYVPAIRNTTLQNYGQICSHLGDYSTAQKLFEEALANSQKCGDRYLEAQLLLSLGEVRRLTYNREDALQAYSECLTITREMGMRRLEMIAMHSMGNVLTDMNKLQDGLQWFQRSRNIGIELDDKPMIGLATSGIGSILSELGNIKAAEECCTYALNVMRELNQSHQVYPVILYSIADIYMEMNNFPHAQACIIQAQKLYEKMDNQQGLGRVFIRRGKFYRLKKEFESSKINLEQALVIAHETNFYELQADVEGELGLLKEAQGDRKGAIELVRRSVTYYQDTVPRCYAQWKKELDRLERAN